MKRELSRKSPKHKISSFCFMSVADMQFKLGSISLKSPSTFSSIIRREISSNAYPIMAWPSQTGRGKENIPISSFTYPYRALSHLWFTLLLHSFFFPQTTSTEGCQPESDCLWASGMRQSFTHSLQGVQCCFAYQTTSQQILYLFLVFGDGWPNLINDTDGKTTEDRKVLVIPVL